MEKRLNHLLSLKIDSYIPTACIPGFHEHPASDPRQFRSRELSVAIGFAPLGNGDFVFPRRKSHDAWAHS
jgi:hypothetical protein